MTVIGRQVSRGEECINVWICHEKKGEKNLGAAKMKQSKAKTAFLPGRTERKRSREKSKRTQKYGTEQKFGRR